MASKFLNLKGLKECLNTQNPSQLKEYVDNICSFFDNDLSSAELELALEVLFDESTGTVGLLQSTIKNQKLFKDGNAIIFDLWAKILQNHANNTNFRIYQDRIRTVCIEFISSMNVSAKEKENATVVLQELLDKNILQSQDAHALLKKIVRLSDLKSKQSRFSQQIYRLMGIISRKYPEISVDHADDITDCFLRTLESTLLAQEGVQLHMLTGSMEGLKSHLVNFAPSLEDRSETINRIYACIKKLSSPNEKNKAPFRASIDLFTSHSNVFSFLIFKDYEFWHNCLVQWISSNVLEDRRKGVYAMLALLAVIAENLPKIEEEKGRKVCHFFLSYIRTILESSSSRPHETRIAIRGFGNLSESAKDLLPDSTNDILSLVVQRSELISIVEDSALRDNLEHFPDYAQALSKIILKIEDSRTAQILLQNIQHIITKLILDFHFLAKIHHGLVVNSISEALFHLSKMRDINLDKTLEKIMLHGVIYSCSHKLVYDAENDWKTDIDWKDNITYKSYLPLWTGILDGNETNYVYDKPLVSKLVFESLISVLFIILEKLNLRTKRRVFADEQGRDQEFFFCDPNIDLCPVKPRDFHIFFNLVDLYRDILTPLRCGDNFRPWINEFCTKMMWYSVQNPLISGFLKLLEIGLTHATRLNYFVGETIDEHYALKSQLSYFLQSIISKSQRVSGELQASCIELLLKFPVQFYRDLLLELTPVIKIAFKMGKNNNSIIQKTINCLDRIVEYFGSSMIDLRKFYEKVLPCMDNFLQSRTVNEDVGIQISRHKNKRRIQKRKIQIMAETPLLKVQKRMIAFLGKIEPQNATLLLTEDENMNLVKWDVEQSIRLTLHLPDMKPTIFLDAIMPRVCQLALTSNDRTTKIAACELLHAVILFLLGTRNTSSQMWKELFSRMLLLGSENDTTVQLMFEPLLMQIMHYASKIENLHHNTVLMDVLMEGVSDSENSSVRDLSARCIREFVEWSIKQTTPEQLAASPVSIELILERFKVYSFDSASNKRIGAALAFNNLYRKLREEESICDNFFIDLLYTFCINYKLSEELSATTIGSLNTELEQVSLSLDHVVRVLKERNYLFNKINVIRMRPAAMSNGTLHDTLLYLLTECGSRLMNYRHKCIGIVETLVDRVTNCTSLSYFLQKYTTKDQLQDICEGSINGSGIRCYPTIKHLKTLTPMSVYTWLEHFLCSLDCYCWFLNSYSLQHPEILFENEKIFQSITSFFNDFCWKNFYEIFEDMSSENTESSESVQFGVDVMNKIDTIKCIIIVRILDFLANVHVAGCGRRVSPNFWEENQTVLLKLFDQIIYEPRELSFDFKSEEIIEKLPERILNVMKAFKVHMKDSVFYNILQNKIIDSLMMYFEKLTSSISEILHSHRITEYQLNMVRGVMFVCKNLKLFSISENNKLWLENFIKSLTSDLFNGMKIQFEGKETVFRPSPDVKKFVNKILKVCFTVQDLSMVISEFILVNHEISLDATGERVICHGEYFFFIFKRTILEHINERFSEVFCSVVFSNMSTSNFVYLIRIFIDILEHLYKYHQKNHQLLKLFVDLLLSNLTIVFDCFDDGSQDLLIVDLLANLAMISPFPFETFKKKQPKLEQWILMKLTDKNKNLEEKSRIVFLLPLVTGSIEDVNTPVTNALELLQQTHFPLRSNEFPSNSLQETGLKSIFKALFQALVASQSSVILDFLVKCTASDRKHILEWLLREETKNFMLKLGSDEQMRCLGNVFSITCSQNLEPIMRCTILERFLITLIQNAKEETNMKFYTENIKKIKDLTETNYGFGKSGFDVEHAIVNRIVGFQLIEVMSVMLPKEKLTSKDCSIGRALLGDIKSGNEFIGFLTKKSFYARTEIFVTDDHTAAELYRIYQCAAYRTICCLVSNSQTDLRFYSKLLFEENSTKNEFIWRKLIDCSNDSLYTEIGQEFDQYLKIKDRFVSIRKSNVQLQNEKKFTSKQLQTQNIFQSSLSQDVTNIDLNYSIIRTDTDVLLRTEKETSHNIGKVSLEKHNLNKHEVMPTLCYVIKHMLDSGITPVVTDPNVKRSYIWITSITDSMIDPTNHKNIRLFLAQLIDNCREIFQHYVYLVFRPVLEVLVDKCAGDQLNIFVTDLTVLLLSWSSKNLYKPSSPEERHLLSSLVKFYMENAYHEKQQIFKYNLEIIRTMFTVWKDMIAVPSQLLLNLLTRVSRMDSHESQCGIILMGIVLENELIPWSDATFSAFMNALYMTLSNESTVISKPAAQVMGMVLALLPDGDIFDSTLSEVSKIIWKNLKKNEQRSMDLLYGLQKKCPKVLDQFLETISYKIPHSIGLLKKKYLEMFLSALEGYQKDGIYAQVISIGIKSLLKNIEFQLLALHIINRAMPHFEESEIEDIYPHIEECCDSTKAECRDVVYEILIYIAIKYADTLGKKTGMVLLKGLLDVTSQIQNRIFHFWAKEANFPIETHEKFVSLLSDYSLDCGKQFLGLCSQLILDPAFQCEESKRQIFEFETDRESKLTEYNIATDQFHSSYSLRPLFAEPQSLQGQSKDLIGNMISSYIRETNEECFFEPTQDPGRFTQTTKSFTLPTQSLLPFGADLQVLDRRSHGQSKQIPEVLEAEKNTSMDNLRIRFLRDTEKEKRDSTIKIIDYKRRQIDRKNYELKTKDKNVQLYRRYRIGDYPDLLINSLAIMLPLQGLIKRDVTIARQIFVAIFTAIVKELGPEAKQFIISVGDKIQSILLKSKTCDPIVFAAFLEIALYKSEQFNLPPDLVALISKGSNMLTIGALYLENRLNIDWETDEVLSTRTTSTITNDEEHWLSLSDVYNAMADTDVVAAIFSDKMKTDPRLAEAIDLKSNGNYEKAEELLREVIHRGVYLEHHYAYICYYECFVEMGMWSQLSKTVQSQVDNLEELWEDDYNMNFLLPNLILSELQTTLHNKASSKEFICVLQSWMEDSTKTEYFKTNLCEELMMFFIADQNFKQARVYSENYVKAFLTEWGIVSSLNYKLRHQNLLKAQRVSELDQYALILNENLNDNGAESLARRWSQFSIEKTECLRFWNTMIVYRTYIAHILRNQDPFNKLEDIIFDMNLQLVNASIHRRNYELSENIVARLSTSSARSDRKKDLMYKVARIQHLLLQTSKSQPETRIEHLCSVWNNARKLCDESSFPENFSLQIDIFDINCKIGRELFDVLDSVELNQKQTSLLIRTTDKSAASDMQQRTFDQCFWFAEKASKLVDRIATSDLNISNSREIANNFYRLAQFCYDYHDHPNLQYSMETDRMFIDSVFKAMKYNSVEARQLFPCILQLNSIEEGLLCDYFTNCSVDVPDWVFLSWIPQILSRLNFKSASYLDDIIRRLAKTYPSALRYPFYVWNEQYLSSFAGQALIIRSCLKEIVDILRHPLADRFIKVLTTLCLPEILLKTHVEEFVKNIRQHDVTQESFLYSIDCLISNVYDKMDVQGAIFKKILKYKEQIENWRQLKHRDSLDVILNEVSSMKQALELSVKRKGEVPMKSLCPWLAEFQWCGQDEFLELPGQYEGKQRPNITGHVTVVKFGSQVEILNSLRLPLRITVYGSDAKTYEFLVKYGEDLKQDQRIQQLLGIMSEKLSQDQNCVNNKLFIRTFDVIPITRLSGILRWVPDTITLLVFIKNCLGRRVTDGAIIEKTARKFVEFIQNALLEERTDDKFVMYGKAVTRYSRDQIVTNIRSLENVVHPEVIKFALVDVSVSPESFFVLRNNFATSLAAMSIAHWILGIGDRHPKNILISNNTARLTGIDFGYTFGTGIRDLPVPELSPFRLTSHTVNAFNPMGTSGTIFKCMAHSLRVYRNSTKIIVACMEVFVREPTVNWLRRTTTPERSLSRAWEPKDRVEVAEYKLLGFNPVTLIERELRNGYIASNKEFLDGYIKLLRGHRQFNIRASLSETNLTVEEQIKCLIDIATDPAILGVAFENYLSWL